ncbi:MAG: hypothetical protein AB3N33_09525 [Puniceicoccaceae bacterium]
MLKLSHLSFLLVVLTAIVPGLHGQGDAGSANPDKPSATDKTSTRIIDLHLQARGGADKLEKLPMVRIEGDLVENIKEYRLNIILEAPGRIRHESTIRHMGDDYLTVSATDGPNVWRQETLPERKNPQRLSGLEKQLVELDGMLPFLFTHRAENGHVCAYRGKDTFAKREVYVLHAWLTNGLEIEVLFDAQSFHIINYRQPYTIGGKVVQIDRAPAGLTRVGETWWEKGYVYRFRGKAFREISFSSIIPAGEVADDTFTEPPTYERWLKIKR